MPLTMILIATRMSDARLLSGRRTGAYPVAGSDVGDRVGQEVWVLAGGEVAAREGDDLGCGYSFAGRRDLAMLIGVFIAAADVQRHRAVQFSCDRGEVPARRVAAMFLDEAGPVMEEHCSAPADQCRPQLNELSLARVVAARVHPGLLPSPDERRRRVLRTQRTKGTKRRPEHRSSPPWMRMRVGEQTTIHHEARRDSRRDPIRFHQSAAKKFQQSQRAIVETDHDSTTDAVVPPQGLDEIGSSVRRMRVALGFVRIALTDGLGVQSRTEPGGE